nr:MAG TPA: zinc-ribbon containing domain protein [Caudoviricetes sp.]
MIEKELKIREVCGDYALDIPFADGSVNTIYFNSKRNAETVKHIIEIDESKPNEVIVRDMQEIKHAKWEEIRDAYGQLEGWIHIECGRKVKIKENYCPSCGAKMDKE